MNTDQKTAFLHLCSSVLICGLLLFAGCDRSDSQRKVVLYTSVDQPYAAAIVREFEKQTGISVVLVTDAEATKSVGLAERLRAEKANPQADVFWGNEPFHTINLADEGLLQRTNRRPRRTCRRSSKIRRHRWASNALRVRVIAGRVAEHVDVQPRSLDELTEPDLKDQSRMARPGAGTTGGHVAALYVLWGDEKADGFFRDLRANDIKLLGGNSVVAEMVAKGTLLAGLTDNDDVAAARRDGGIRSGAARPGHDRHADGPDDDRPGERPAESERSEAVDRLPALKTDRAAVDRRKVRGLDQCRSREGEGDGRRLRRRGEEVARAVRQATAILEGRE